MITHVQAPMPEGAREGILKGMYKFSDNKKAAQILGSGAILPEAIKASALLEEKYGVSTNVWSVTSYKNLIEMQDVERHNLRTGEAKKPYFATCLGEKPVRLLLPQIT